MSQKWNEKNSDDEVSSDSNTTSFEFFSQSGEVISSLPLQMSLYLNLVFLPFWIIIMLAMLFVKYDCLSSIYRFIVVLVLTCLIAIEFVRLFLGYVGNLYEKIPELAGFWVLSLLLQFPLHLFVLFSTALHPLPIESVSEVVMLAFLVAQLCTGFVTLRKCAYHQAQQFQLQYGGKFIPTPS